MQSYISHTAEHSDQHIKRDDAAAYTGHYPVSHQHRRRVRSREGDIPLTIRTRLAVGAQRVLLNSGVARLARYTSLRVVVNVSPVVIARFGDKGRRPAENAA
eukprot:7732643-Pyramimonas_sp.AAC.1